MNTNTCTPLTDLIQIGEILYASGLFGGLQNKEQGIARILRGQELGIPPVAAMTDERTLLPPKASNAQQITNLLNELGITDPKQRKAIATDHLVGRKAADLTPEELEEVLGAIRQAYAQEEETIEEVETVETVVVDNSPEPAQAPEPVATPPETIEATVDSSDEDESTDARAAISAALDGAGITDVNCRQVLVKKQLLAVKRRKVEMLTPEELATVIEGIAAAA